MNKKKQYYYSLDLFRGFCGYGVAITHFFAFLHDVKFMEYLSILFVEFFFVLSGFVLYPQLIKVLEKKKNLLIFYQRRWLRTLPLYFLFLTLVSILTYNFGTYDFFKYFFFIQNIYPNFLNNDYFPIAWSLSIEEFFYIFFPIFLIFLNKDNFIKTTLIFFAFFMIIKFIFFSNLNYNFYRTGTIIRFDAIYIGFLLARYKEYFLRYFNYVLITFFFFLLIFFIKKNFFLFNLDKNLIKIFYIIILQLLSCSFLLIFLKSNKYFSNKNLIKFAYKVSCQTYSVYLMHIILIYILKNLNFSLLFNLLIYIFFLVVFSSLIYRYIEKPILTNRPKY